MMLSAFACYSFKKFRRLNPRHRENIVILCMTYSGCMRFGLFHHAVPRRFQVTFVAHTNAYRLEATWRKTHKSNRPYAINVPLDSSPDSPGFIVQHPSGPTVVTTGMLIHWLIRAAPDQQSHDSSFFPTLSTTPNRRLMFSSWLKAMFTMTLPHGSTIPARIRPHSGRAGWVSDRVRSQVPAETIMSEGRWASRAAMQSYSDLDSRLVSLE